MTQYEILILDKLDSITRLLASIYSKVSEEPKTVIASQPPEVVLDQLREQREAEELYKNLEAAKEELLALKDNLASLVDAEVLDTNYNPIAEDELYLEEEE